MIGFLKVHHGAKTRVTNGKTNKSELKKKLQYPINEVSLRKRTEICKFYNQCKVVVVVG